YSAALAPLGIMIVKQHEGIAGFNQEGARDNGAPGLRPQYHPDYYGAFVVDPDGHNIEAVCHEPAPAEAPT
ncbi:MAG: hypothetical protein ACREF3_21265, partial [Acetobacteraceae bacterium]